MKYRKKPVVIEAVQWFKHGDHTEVKAIEHGRWPFLREWERAECGCIITLESPTGFLVHPGDWIIKGVKGEFYACKPDIFAATYEDASTAAPEGETTRARIITECREACMDVHAGADEAAKAKDAIGEPYKTGYIDAAIDCDEALFQLLSIPPQGGRT